MYFREKQGEKPHEPLFTQPLAEDWEDEPLVEEPDHARSRGRWQLAAGVADVLAIVACMGLIFALLTLLFSIVDFVQADLLRSFPVLQQLF